MPSYFYHLKFELYPSQDPTVSSLIGHSSTSSLTDDIWLPKKPVNIFDDLPAHFHSLTAPPRDSTNSNKPPRTADPVPTIQTRLETSVIDCGTPRPREARDGRTFIRLSTRQRTLSFPPPSSDAAINPRTAVKDWRFGPLSITSIDLRNGREGNSNMVVSGGPASSSAAAAASEPSMGGAGRATKAKYVPLTIKNTNIGWGIVHLYREGNESPELDQLATQVDAEDGEDYLDATNVDCTTLCIPAVPSYLSPSDFLGFVGDRWRDEVTHYRMVMTGRMNRYLVLIKFRDSKRAHQFRKEFDGKVFNNIEPEACSVAFVRSVTFETPAQPNGSFPDLSRDPFTPSSVATGSLKPFPPPTPSLMVLPTCPVCLERMDDTTGLLTIPCQHVFHCSCLQKWKGSGCPVCRHTNPSNNKAGQQRSSATSSHPTTPYDASNPYAQPFGSYISNLCTICDTPDDLWICLICGNVGCGRYKGGHAKEHWKDTAHTFSLELMTQHVWDYAGDMWVHRLIRDKGDGKVVELPGRHQGPNHDHQRGHGGVGGFAEREDVVPRSKLDNIGMEYTHLLTSQLESQRVYFEEMLSKAADKAAKASAAADAAAAQASEAIKELRSLKEEYTALRTDMMPSLEKDLERERTRAVKSTDLSRSLSKTLQEEKKVSEGLMKRIEHINKEVETLGKQVAELKVENADLKDQNHDLSMFISGQEKLKQLEAEGGLEEGEIQEGSVAVPEDKKRRKGKGKAK